MAVLHRASIIACTSNEVVAPLHLREQVPRQHRVSPLLTAFPQAADSIKVRYIPILYYW